MTGGRVGVLNSLNFELSHALVTRLQLGNNGKNSLCSRSLPPFNNQKPKSKNPSSCFIHPTYLNAADQLPVKYEHGVVENDRGDQVLEVSISSDIKQYVETIKSMLCSLDDGEINIAAYDTAWLALIEDVNGSGSPQFPSALQWIVNNQFADGSWGDADVFSAYERMLSTLACVFALKKWNLYQDKRDKGMSFILDNLRKLEDEKTEHMTCGFEVIFPTLLEIGQKLDIEVPKDSPVLQEIYSKRNLKLTRIPTEVLHNVPTTLLYSLEGIPGINWEKMLKLQCKDGSFLFSPASTAFAYMQTKDENCLIYLNKTSRRFNGPVPCAFPVDLFEHIWVVDRLQRLGISRYFEPEIKQCVNYVYRNWSDQVGICWTRTDTKVPDLDCTSMGFRILRLHGYHVSAEAFKHFEDGSKFFCFPKESTGSVSVMKNLYRASQVRFRGEEILDTASIFSFNFLREKQSANELQDKWVISKDLPGEVGLALDLPWYATLPRVESRFYVEQYGGKSDVWIAKTLYRLPNVSNNMYLDLAKLDFNNCQAMHCSEWDDLQKWYEECNLQCFGISERSLLLAYFLAAANIFEPERKRERIAWTKTSLLAETIQSFFSTNNKSREQRRAFVNEFKLGFSANDWTSNDQSTRQELLKLLLRTIQHLAFEASVAHSQDISPSLLHAVGLLGLPSKAKKTLMESSGWVEWLLKWEVEGDRYTAEAELLVQTIHLTSSFWISKDILAHHPQYEQLCNLTNRICYQLGHYQKNKAQENGSYNMSSNRITTPQIESDMQQLVQLVFQNCSNSIDSNIKKTFFIVVKSFYYNAYCSAETVNYHIAKVLFERVY